MKPHWTQRLAEWLCRVFGHKLEGNPWRGPNGNIFDVCKRCDCTIENTVPKHWRCLRCEAPVDNTPEGKRCQCTISPSPWELMPQCYGKFPARRPKDLTLQGCINCPHIDECVSRTEVNNLAARSGHTDGSFDPQL